MSKVTLELRISPEMSYLHKIQVNKSGSSVETEKVKLQENSDVNAVSKIWECCMDSSNTELDSYTWHLMLCVHNGANLNYY